MTSSTQGPRDRVRSPLLEASDDATPVEQPGGLRRRILTGGVYLVVREGLGVVVGVVGAVALTRMIGPANFGIYVALVVLFTYLQSLATLGINAYLVRSEGELQQRRLHEAFTL